MFDAFIIEKIREEEEAANRRYENERPSLEHRLPDVQEESVQADAAQETPRGVFIIEDAED